MTTFNDLQQLRHLLEHRLAIIADHEWRDRDAASHLAALGEASMALDLWRENHPGIPPRLRHFLEQCSYSKALEFLQDPQTGGASGS